MLTLHRSPARCQKKKKKDSFSRKRELAVQAKVVQTDASDRDRGRRRGYQQGKACAHYRATEWSASPSCLGADRERERERVMEFFGSPTRTFKVRQDDDEGRDISTPFTTASLGTLGFTDAPPAPRKTKKSPNSALLCREIRLKGLGDSADSGESWRGFPPACSSIFLLGIGADPFLARTSPPPPPTPPPQKKPRASWSL